MKWVGSLYRKARYIAMSLQLIPTNPKTNLRTIQLSNRLNVPGANFEQSIDCWIDLLKKDQTICLYYLLLSPRRALMMIT